VARRRILGWPPLTVEDTWEPWVLLVGLAVVGSRFLVPLLIPLYPLPVMIACLVLDAVDQTVFQTIAPGAQLDWYQGYDEALDIYYLSIAYLSTLRNWTKSPCIPDEPVASLLPARGRGVVRDHPGPGAPHGVSQHVRVFLRHR
jgi:hypothetical protein